MTRRLRLLLPALLASRFCLAQTEVTPLRLIGMYGQAFAPPTQGPADLGALAVARDFPVTGRLTIAAEFFPLLIFSQTHRVGPERTPERETVAAVALGLPAGFTVGDRSGDWLLRFDGGSGLFYGFSKVPAGGTHFNFFNQIGAAVIRRLGSGHRIALGYRLVHVSNLHIGGVNNPGLSLHTAVLMFDWPGKR